MVPAGFIEVCVILLLVTLVARTFYRNGMGPYSSLTMWFILLLALSMFIEISRKTIGPLLLIWFVSLLWVLGYAVHKSVLTMW
jgi:hypothetical protein